jgi:hypothetical protein
MMNQQSLRTWRAEIQLRKNGVLMPFQFDETGRAQVAIGRGFAEVANQFGL